MFHFLSQNNILEPSVLWGMRISLIWGLVRT